LIALLGHGLVAQVTELPPGGSFVDDDGNLHEGDIEAIAARDITTGCATDPLRYCPSAILSRAEMGVFLVRAAGQDTNLPPYRGYFADVPPGQWYTAHVERLLELGITRGCGGDPLLYCPGAPVSRAEMAVFLTRLVDEEPNLPPYRGYFADVPPGQWYTAHAERLFELGITRGCATSPPRFCPAGPVRRDQTASFLGRALGLQPIVPPARPPVVLEEVLTGLSRPTFVAAPPGDPRLFVLEQSGRIRILSDSNLETFLDISDLVGSGGERGLLGLAFHPNYPSDDRFYVNYTDRNGDTRVVEYRVSSDPARADPNSARQLVFVDQPFSNHNGGMLVFGPDGLLYAGMGDGGGAGDPQDNAQNLSSLLGKLVRIDVDQGVTEVWASGLRNPWRLAFDPESSQLYIADVGQNAWEEINVVPAAAGGLNYGWDNFEGNHCFEAPCDATGKTFPVLEYSTNDGCAVVGGSVYRGSALPQLEGLYFYGDFCGGWIRSFRYEHGVLGEERQWFTGVGLIQSFGLDGAGEFYVATAEGRVLQFVPGS
jgi:glucose/arabinose dehydrogenase